MNFTQQVTAEKEEKDFKNQLSTHLRQHLGRSVEGGVESGVQGGVVLVEGPQRRPDPARRQGPHPAVDPERNLITTRNLNQIEPIVHFRTELRPEDKNHQNQLLPTEPTFTYNHQPNLLLGIYHDLLGHDLGDPVRLHRGPVQVGFHLHPTSIRKREPREPRA